MLEILWKLRYYHGFTMDEQLTWVPYERDIYIDMTLQEMEKREQERQKQKK